jgi:centromeric protein E
MTSSKRKSGLLKFSSHHRNSSNNNSNNKSNFSLGLLDSQPKGGYSAIYTPVKNKLVGVGGSGIKKKSSSSSGKKNDVAAIVTPATTSTVQQLPSSSGRLTLSSSSAGKQRQSSSAFNEEEEAVKVCIRIKPLLNNERRAWTTSPTDVNTIIKTTSSSNDTTTTTNNNTTYKFDQVYNENSTTTQIYNDIISDIIYSVCNHGRNGTVFTYGQTSTGKTYTMHGIMKEVGRDLFDYSHDNNSGSSSREIETDDDGFILRRVSFEPDSTTKKSSSSNSSTTTTTNIHISCIELYNEELYDLLSSSPNSSNTSNTLPSSLTIHEDRKGNVVIPNLIEWEVSNVSELLKAIEIADEKRTVGSNGMNERSSRSHTIFRIRYVVKKEEVDNKENVVGSSMKKVVTTTSSVLNLVDLAGSESVRLTGAKGIRQKEGGKINQSLLTLSRVLEKLGNKKQQQEDHLGHINYRDSKLTRILKPSLSGNARMGAICCISPDMQYSEETKSTLDFATRTMLVTTNAKSNEVVEQHGGGGDTILMAEYEKEMERIKLESVQAEECRLEMERSLLAAQDEIKALKLQLRRAKETSDTAKEDTMWELMDLTRRNKDLEENMSATLKATELNRQAMELVRRQAKELERDNQELEVEVKELTRQKLELEQKNLDLEQNMQNTTGATVLNKQAMDLIRKQVKDLEKENEVYRAQVEDLTEDNEALRQRNKDLKHNMQNTMSATTLNKQANESIMKQVKDLEKKNGSYIVQVGQLNRRNKELERNAVQTSETIGEMQDTIDELNHANEQLGRRLEMYTNREVQSREDASEKRKTFQGKVETLMGRMREEVEELSLSPKVSFD